MSEIYRVPAGTEMTIELLSYYLSKHKENINSRYQLLQNAYENKYKIYEAPRKSDWKPDNRISINFAEYIVDTFNGFFCGIPVKVTSDDENVSAYIEFLNSYNDQDNGNAEIAKIGDIHGKGNEMYYIDEDGQPCITYLSPLESFFIFDDSILKRPLFFVRFYTDEDGVEHGSWSDSSVVQHFIDDGEIRWVDEPKIHGFPGVPATEFLENEEQMGIFESALPAIDEYNKAISEKGVAVTRLYAKRMVRITSVAGIVGGLLILAVRPLLLLFAGNLTKTAASYLNMMLLINSYYVWAQGVNTCWICGCFRAGGDTRWGMICDILDMWCFSVPLGFLAAFVLKLPVLWVYFLLCLDEFVKIPFVIHHFNKFTWIRNITRNEEELA